MCLHFARVSGPRPRNLVSADMNAVSDRACRYLVAPSAVLAAVPEKPLKNRLKGLHARLAVGPSFFQNRPVTREFFAPLVAQSAQVASGQPDRVRNILL